jgi:hypothetical protein
MANITNRSHQWQLALEQPFDFSDFATAATIANIAPKLPMGAMVLSARMVIETVFNGTTPTLGVGITGTTGKYIATAAVLTATGLVAGATVTGIPLASEETLVLTPNAGAIASTAGKGRVVIEYVVAGRGNEVYP